MCSRRHQAPCTLTSRSSVRRAVHVARTIGAFAALVCVVAATTAHARGLMIPDDPSLGALELRAQSVEIDIRDHAASTHVTQVFYNPTPRDLEATYYFAIPAGAVTTDFALWMNGERVAGEVLPRDQARATYESIVRRMQDPGLLEYVDAELFRASIFPVPAGGEQRVEITYASVVPHEGSHLRYTYPMHGSSGTMGTFAVTGTIHTTSRIGAVYAPYHDVEVIREDDPHRALIGMEATDATPDTDFELYIGLADSDVGMSVITYEPDTGEDGYFMLTLTPTSQLDSLDVVPKQVTLVVDISGSMAGPQMDQARDLLRYSVNHLNPEDTFNIITFSTGVQAVFDTPRRADRGARNEALAFIDTLRARGSTNISGALERALQDPTSPDRPHAIIFITDGIPTVGETSIDALIDLTRNATSDGDRRIFTFGVGYDVNTRLLDTMARRGRGVSGYVRPQEDLSDTIGEFYASISSPLLTHLEFDFGAVEVEQLYPNPLPDLYRDGQVTLFGRYNASATAPVIVTGYSGSERITMEFTPDFSGRNATDRDFVANLWARRHIDTLLTLIEDHGEEDAWVREVTELGVAWNIVTPYTSYLSLEPSMRHMLPPTPTTTPSTTSARMHGTAQSAPDADMSSRSGGFAPPADEDAAEMEAQDLGVVGSGRGGGGFERSRRAQDQPAPAAAPRGSGSRAEVGREAVESSLDRSANLRDATRVAPGGAEATRRVVDGRGFVRASDAWVEDGLDPSARPDRTIRAMSDEYFQLITDHPELARVLALGDRVRFRLGREVIEIR